MGTIRVDAELVRGIASSLRLAAGHNTPGLLFVGVVAVDLEGDRLSRHRRPQFGPAGGAEHNRAALQREVHGKDLRMSVHDQGDPPHDFRLQQRPALVKGQSEIGRR